jgi:glutamate/tyrosine decarboxylase-like PLP-dependent enzyme
MRDAQVFHFDDWPCGHMYTPTFAGTRPGGAIAAAWAVLNYLGREGYEARARMIDDARRQLLHGCEDMGLRVFGEPKLSIVGFGSDAEDILAVGEGLYAGGWFSSRLKDPDGIQYMISPEHQRTMPDYLQVLRRHVEDVRAGRRTRAQGSVSYS